MDSSNDRPAPNLKLVEKAAATAAVLGATAAIVALSAHETERAHPPAGKFVDVMGVRLHYLERGTGSPVVLVHGNAMSSEDFVASGIFERLAMRHRVIAFDRPGFGYSQRPRGVDWTAIRQADLLGDALKALEIVDPIVVGHSFGALVTAALAIAEPTALRAIVLLSGYYYPSMPFAVPAFAVAATSFARDIARYTAEPILARLTSAVTSKMLFAPAPVPASFDAYPLAMSRRPSQIRATAEDAYFMESDASTLHGRYREIIVPTFVIGGVGDALVDTPAQSKRLASDVARGTFSAVDGAGHMVHYIATDRIVDAIESLAP